MFKVKNITTGNIEQALSVFCDEYGKAWFYFGLEKNGDGGLLIIIVHRIIYRRRK